MKRTKKDPELSAVDQSLLALLSRGMVSKDVASALGFTPGTVRVYLHKLYAKLGVSGMAGAIAYYESLSPARSVSYEQRGKAEAQASVNTRSVGGFASEHGLGYALGAMQMFVGPYCKGWDVLIPARLSESKSTKRVQATPLNSHTLWSHYLDAEFAAAKALSDPVDISTLAQTSKSDALVLFATASFGGYSTLADRIQRSMPVKRGGIGVSTVDERRFMGALGADASSWDDYRIAALTALSTNPLTRHTLRHICLVALFHSYIKAGYQVQASQVASTLWTEAERERADLEASGVVTFIGTDTRTPEPPPLPEKKFSRYLEKIAE